MRKALITGISGQDGFYLSQFLLEKGYSVYGLVRRNSQASIGNLDKLPKETKDRIKICWGDITDFTHIPILIKKEQFDEVYHLAAQSFVQLSFTNPFSTYEINIGGTLNIVNAVKEFSPQTKFYFAATSELFGRASESPQNENSPFYPRSPYGISKLAGFWTVKNYREAYNLYMCSGILFNHESPIRTPEFVTRKISLAATAQQKKVGGVLSLGNLDAKRDWGFSKDYCEGMYKMLQQKEPDDYVLATGKNHSIREFVEEAYNLTGRKVVWGGSGTLETGRDAFTEELLIKVDPLYFRPTEVDLLLGDASKAKRELGWEPKTSFEELVRLMIESDMGT